MSAIKYQFDRTPGHWNYVPFILSYHHEGSVIVCLYVFCRFCLHFITGLQYPQKEFSRYWFRKSHCFITLLGAKLCNWLMYVYGKGRSWPRLLGPMSQQTPWEGNVNRNAGDQTDCQSPTRLGECDIEGKWGEAEDCFPDDRSVSQKTGVCNLFPWIVEFSWNSWATVSNIKNWRRYFLSYFGHCLFVILIIIIIQGAYSCLYKIV